MTAIEDWVIGANITRLQGQLADPEFSGLTTELTRRLAEEEQKLLQANGNSQVRSPRPEAR